jgi:DNA-binding protein HU-beta
MGEKLVKLGIKRDNELMYYIKSGDVYAVPRKKPGQPKGKAQKVAAAGIDMDYSKYLYYLDGDGDVARKERQVGGSKRKKAASAPKKAAPKKAAPKKAAKPAAKKAPAKKAPAKKAPAKKAPAKKPAKKGKKR